MIPLIYLGYLGAAAAVGLVSRRVARDYKEFNREFNNKNRLGILGMQTSGKTRFLSFIRGVPYVEKQTNRNQYEEFKYMLTNGKNIIIKSGVDIGGGKLYRPDYNKIIDESDVILYFFDIYGYLNNVIDNDNEYYQRSCNSRFEHIYSRVTSDKIPVVIVATHRDKCDLSENDIKQKFDNLVQTKTYKTMLKDVQYVNLTSPSETKYLVSKIFNNKK